MKNWLDAQEALGYPYAGHPESPEGRDVDWNFEHGLPHPGSPCGRDFDWPGLDLPHPSSPAGHYIAWDAPGICAVQADVMDPEIEALDLEETARKAAYLLKKAHPAVKFTSGRRTKAQQASAMAENIVADKKHGRKWIEHTYKRTAAHKALQKWVDDNPDKKSKEELKAGLLSVMDKMTESELFQVSKHLTGKAFDVQPVEKDGAAIQKTIKALPGLQLFLDHEGKLKRWHAQFE